jgi:glycopeptide antibiotics resistance protein
MATVLTMETLDSAPIVRRFAQATLIVYLAVILSLTLLMFPGPHPGPNLVPFRTIASDCRNGGREMWVNLVGNVLAFAPLGLLLPLVGSRRWDARGIAGITFVLSGMIEVTQYLSGRRVGDVDDVILDVAGALLGFALLVGARGWIGRRHPV